MSSWGKPGTSGVTRHCGRCSIRSLLRCAGWAGSSLVVIDDPNRMLFGADKSALGTINRPLHWFDVRWCHLLDILARFCQQVVASVELRNSPSFISPKKTL